MSGSSSVFDIVVLEKFLYALHKIAWSRIWGSTVYITIFDFVQSYEIIFAQSQWNYGNDLHSISIVLSFVFKIDGTVFWRARAPNYPISPQIY